MSASIWSSLRTASYQSTQSGSSLAWRSVGFARVLGIRLMANARDSLRTIRARATLRGLERSALVGFGGGRGRSMRGTGPRGSPKRAIDSASRGSRRESLLEWLSIRSFGPSVGPSVRTLTFESSVRTVSFGASEKLVAFGSPKRTVSVGASVRTMLSPTFPELFVSSLLLFCRDRCDWSRRSWATPTWAVKAQPATDQNRWKVIVTVLSAR